MGINRRFELQHYKIDTIINTTCMDFPPNIS